MSTKTCPNCNKIKRISNFSKNSNSPDGLAYYCKECHNHKSKIRRQANPEKIRATSISSNQRFNMAVSRAKKRELSWELALDQWISLVIDNVCHYCNGQMSQTGVGLDRKDNNIGYVMGNVIPCCCACNRIKSMYLSYEEMLAVASLLKQMRS